MNDRLLTPVTPGAPAGSSGLFSPTAAALRGGSLAEGTSPVLGLVEPELQLCSFVFPQPCFVPADAMHVVESLFTLGDLARGGVVFPVVHNVRVNAVPTVFKDIAACKTTRLESAADRLQLGS